MNYRRFARVRLAATFLGFLAAAGPVNGQVTIAVEEVIREMSRGMQPGFEMTIPDATFKSVESRLVKFMRKGSRGRVKTVQGELFLDGAVRKNIYPEPFRLYIRHLEVAEGLRLTAFYTMDDTTFLSGTADPDRAAAAKKSLRDFGVERYRDAVEDELESQERILKNLEDELESMVKDSRKADKDIKDAKREIKRKKDEIRDLETRIAAKAEEILAQHDIVSSLQGTGGEEEKIARKRLKTLEKEKKKLEKSADRSGGDIDDLEGRIDDRRRFIDKNENLEESKKKEIETQQVKVDAIKEKLNGIR
jgi:predicted  nucleic acid-binding Zn-ribbon protein